MPALDAIYRFGPYELRTRTYEVYKNGIKLKVRPQPSQVLQALVQRSGDVVTREELRQLLWTAETFVDFEHGLNTAIKELRGLLNDSASEPRYIETLPRRGYRFIERVYEARPEASIPPASRNSTFDPGEIHAVAVLPLEDLSGDAERDYFADGMTEALITSLAKIKALRVISRTSAMQYKGVRKSLPQIARELSVDAVIEGSVLRSGERVRIAAQLIRAASDEHLWAESYERDFRDILSLQSEIAREIANQVRIVLTPEEKERLGIARSVDPETHESYLKARYFWNKRTEESVKKALAHFLRAIDRDPTYAQGYAGLADSYNILAYYNALPPTEAYSKAKAAAFKALALDNSLAEPHAALGVVKRDFEWDWRGAENEFQRAIELNPGYVESYHWRATLLSMLGQHAEAIHEKNRALTMDPLSVVIRTDLARMFYYHRDYDHALEHYRAALEMDPNHLFAHIWLAHVYEQKGLFEQAISELKAGVHFSGDSTFALAKLGHGYAMAGRRNEAEAVLKQLNALSKQKYVSPYDVAMVHVALQENEEAFAWLERAVEERSLWLGYLNVDPQLDALRSDRRFQKLLGYVGLLNFNTAERIEKTTQADPNLRHQIAGELRADLACLKHGELAPSSRHSNQHATLPPHNLPLQHSALVGREREIDEICNELRGDFVRLLTLTGVGGTGKTTLGLAAGRRLLPNFADGVFFVDLAGVKQAELVPSAVAQPLGIREGDGKPILQMLKDRLRRNQTLLILDNFEQVLPAAFLLTELLAAAPGLKILVTSRSRLQLTLEREYVVPPLATPSLSKEHSPNDLMRYGAVKLFVDRARSAMGNFILTPDNARPVAEICARLDGLPLGIELAAARMKVLSPRAILARLDHRLTLLTGGARDLPSRQQTMTNTMDWSYELLNDNERCLFQRVAVFSGGFTFESAEEVAGELVSVSEEGKDGLSASKSQALDVLETLTCLVNQSLVMAEVRTGVDMRFRMLGIVREYALERLQVSGESEAIQQRHAGHFLVLAEAAEQELQSARPERWLNRLEEEYDNIREALRWSIVNDPQIAARIGAAIRYFWDYMGYLTEGIGILKEILKKSDQIPSLLRCKLFSMAGNIAKFQRDDEVARQLYESGLCEARSIRDLSQVSALCRGLGGLAVEQGDHATARRFIDDALAAAQQANDQFGIARSLNMLGDLARVEGDNGTARVLLKKALEVCRQTDRRYPTAIILNNLAAAEFGDGDYEAAYAHFTEGLTMAQDPEGKVAGNKIAISYSLDGFAGLAAHSGRARVAATLAGAAEHLRQSMGFRIESAESRFREAYIALIRAVLPDKQFAAAYEQGSKLELDDSIALAFGKDIPEAS